jgi:hypothetical protein
VRVNNQKLSKLHIEEPHDFCLSLNNITVIEPGLRWTGYVAYSQPIDEKYVENLSW